MGFFTHSDDDKRYAETTLDRPNNALSAYSSSILGPVTLNDIADRATSSFNSLFSQDSVNDVLSQLRSLDKWALGGSVAGLKAYPVPSVEKYEQCVANDGASVWDENGWWRCLFPDAKARVGEVSREDVEADMGHKRHGLFFRDYNELLQWKSIVKQARAASTIQEIYDDYANDGNLGEQQQHQHQQQQLPPQQGFTSSTVVQHYRTLENGDAEEITETRSYDKGKTHTEKVRKLYPKDGGEPVITHLEPRSKLKEWIWNDK
jgi:hypothetical protein